MKDAYSIDAGLAQLNRSYDAMYEAYCRIFDRCGLPYVIVEAESGPIGQSFVETLTAAFHAAHQREYGRHFPEKDVELVNLRLVGVGAIPDLVPPPLPSGGEAPDPAARAGSRRVVFEDGGKPVGLEADIYRRPALRAGNRVKGPAIVQQMDTTTVIPPDVVATVDRHGNLVVTL